VSQMLSGQRKAEEVLPYFVSTYMYQGVSGIVIAGVLAAAMSSLSSSINAISAVSVTDIYKRHLKKDKTDQHYVFVAKMISLASSVIMIGGAYWLSSAESMTLQDTATKLNSISAGGLLGLFMLGFLTIRGDGRAVFVGIIFTLIFSTTISLYELKVFSAVYPPLHDYIKTNFDTYYTTILGNFVMFITGYFFGTLLPKRKRDLTNLTVWTQDKSQPAT